MLDFTTDIFTATPRHIISNSWKTRVYTIKLLNCFYWLLFKHHKLSKLSNDIMHLRENPCQQTLNNPTGRKFSLDFKFCYFAKSKFVKSLISAYNYIFRNLLVKAYWLKIKNQNLLIFNAVNLTNLSQVAKLNSVEIFIL